MKDNTVKEHEVIRHLTEVVVTPEHEERTESKLFRESKKRLHEDGHFKCWVCDSTEDLEVHHFIAEWSLAEACDFDKLKKILMIFDPYGYSKQMINEDIVSVDDIRNQMVLCKLHHTHPETGIHMITFPAWISQKYCQDGENPIPHKY